MPGVHPWIIPSSQAIKPYPIRNRDGNLDPIGLLSSLLPKITDLNTPFAVNLSDSKNSISIPLSVFTSRDHPISEGFIKFGLTCLKLNELKVSVSYDLVIDLKQ